MKIKYIQLYSIKIYIEKNLKFNKLFQVIIIKNYFIQ